MLGGILLLMPIFYFISNLEPNIYTTAAYIIILAPTLAALINGAPFVPTPMAAAEHMVKTANIQKDDKVYDIGCGDGRLVHLAAKQGANAVGFELSPLVYLFAKIRQWIWRSKGKIKFGNFKRKNISDADLVLCYLLPETLAKIAPDLQKKLKPGTRLLSYAFPVANWDVHTKHERIPEKNISHVWEYRVP